MITVTRLSTWWWPLYRLYLRFRGCTHPKLEPVGTLTDEINGETVAIFLDVCTVCGLTIVSTT